MSFVRVAVACVVAAGCAEASRTQGNLGQRPDGGRGQQIDSPTQQQRDSSTVFMDAPSSMGGTKTLSETTASNDTGVAVACGDGATYTSRNSYYRVFALSDYSIAGPFSVTKVDFGVSQATNGPQLKVSVGTYSGTVGGSTLSTASISLATSQTITAASTDTSESVPLSTTIPAGSNVIVEIDQTNAGSTSNGIQFYIAANASGETKPGYVSSPDCSGASTPTSMTQVAGAEADMVVTVTGTY